MECAIKAASSKRNSRGEKPVKYTHPEYVRLSINLHRELEKAILCFQVFFYQRWRQIRSKVAPYEQAYKSQAADNIRFITNSV